MLILHFTPGFVKLVDVGPATQKSDLKIYIDYNMDFERYKSLVFTQQRVLLKPQIMVCVKIGFCALG